MGLKLRTRRDGFEDSVENLPLILDSPKVPTCVVNWTVDLDHPVLLDVLDSIPVIDVPMEGAVGVEQRPEALEKVEGARGRESRREGSAVQAR